MARAVEIEAATSGCDFDRPAPILAASATKSAFAESDSAEVFNLSTAKDQPFGISPYHFP